MDRAGVSVHPFQVDKYDRVLVWGGGEHINIAIGT